MTELEAIFLGGLQGLSEFLPISSSGHLTITQHLFGLAENPLTLNIALHIATLVVIVLFYRKTIINILFPLNYEYLLAIIITSIPTACIGFLIKAFEDRFFTDPKVPSLLLVVNGIFLFSLARIKNSDEDREIRCPKPLQAFIIGVFQGIAALPGVSRSGSTIGIARIMKIHPQMATEYSLLASIPVILGASLLEMKDMTSISDPGKVFLGAIAAGVFGWFAVKMLQKIVKAGAWRIWGIYCIIAGLTLTIYTW